MTLTVLDPTADGTTINTMLNPRPVTLSGLTVGLLDNGKPNSDRFLEALRGELAARGVTGFRSRRKANVGRLADPGLIAELAADTDLVITGVGDCAGCCSCSTHDGLSVERAGTPTFIVCTTEFLTTATIAARTGGAPDYPFSVIEHPFGSLTPDQVQARAAEVAALIDSELGTRAGALQGAAQE